MINLKSAYKHIDGKIILHTNERFMIFWQKEREFHGKPCRFPGHYDWVEMPGYKDITGLGIYGQLNIWAQVAEMDSEKRNSSQ